MTPHWIPIRSRSRSGRDEWLCTVLTATADDDMEDGDGDGVVASGSGITGNMQVTVAVTDTTEPVVPEPVPALPLIAQWLLGLGLMGGGARQLFRRRRQG